LNNTALALRRYLEGVDFFGGDISEVIRMQREALDLIEDKYRGLYLRNLALSFRSRYQSAGSPADLDEAIRLRREVLALYQPGHPVRVGCLSGLAWDLTLRYEAHSNNRDLEEAIHFGRESLSFHPVGHQYRFRALEALANALQFTPDHLDEALQMSRDSLSVTPTTSPYRWEKLMNLANILLSHYGRSDAAEELEEATSVCEMALSLCLTSHFRRPKLLALQAKLAEAKSIPPSIP
jgi:tetratricopeptide (TPR) repeat protein